MSHGMVHELAPDAYEAWRWESIGIDVDGYVLVRHPPRHYNPHPKFGLRVDPLGGWRASTDIDGGRYSFFAKDTP
jgi:hypothetical protein